ncbi:MAG: T9SS type A sorting domain-containing protein [Bacteroidetes bacterium]|nr:T9SS type A sorting domain-containing protein [Bacteroidota bacterium]
MKAPLLLLFTLITLSAPAQTSVYHPFPESNAFWCGYEQWYDGSCDHTAHFTTYFGTDTLINGFIYHKLIKSGYEYSSICGGGGYYYYPAIAIIRQDTLLHKVFMYDTSLARDTTFYDFNLVVGDTLDKSKVIWGNVQFCTVTSVDSILINGQYRKRFNHNCSYGCPDSSIIEGIGSISGLMSGPSSCFEYFASLSSFEQDDIGLYPDSSWNCDIISGVKSSLEAHRVFVYPNPVFDQLNVVVNNNELTDIFLYDIASRVINQKKFIGSVSLNTEDLSKGIYLYELSNKNGVIKQGKIVKE